MGVDTLFAKKQYIQKKTKGVLQRETYTYRQQKKSNTSKENEIRTRWAWTMGGGGRGERKMVLMH